MKDYYPLTFAQKAIWNVENLATNKSINNIFGTIHFKERINRDLLEKSINLLLKKNLRFGLNLEF